MGYMERNFDKRLDPRKLVPGAKSVVSLLFNYFPENTPSDSDAPKIARYAYGQDYHRVIKDKLFEFMHEIQTEIGAVGGRVFVDSAPVMEKAWAAKSGLGWVGKNTNLIRKQEGSYFLSLNSSLIFLLKQMELLPIIVAVARHALTLVQRMRLQLLINSMQVSVFHILQLNLKRLFHKKLRENLINGLLAVTSVRKYAHGIGFQRHTRSLPLTQIRN